MRNYLFQIIAGSYCLLGLLPHASAQSELKSDAFTVQTQAYGISLLQKTNDLHPTNYSEAEQVLGDIDVFYAYDRKTFNQSAAQTGTTYFKQNHQLVGTYAPKPADNVPLSISQSFDLTGDTLYWQLQFKNTGDQNLRIEDLAIPLHYRTPDGENPEVIFEQSAIKHQYISGDNSWVFFERPTGLGPYLLMTPQPGTSLEFFSTKPLPTEEFGAFKIYIHATHSVNSNLKGNWRQPVSYALLAPHDSISYSFKLQWANNYQAIRDKLVDEGLIDVQVMPGMTVPTDLDVRLALRTVHPIDSIVPEFGAAETKVQFEEEKVNQAKYFNARFSHLGENKLTVYYGEKYRTQLDFFVTEPLETLYKKRAAFIANRQQICDSTKWYDGLFGVYDMKNAELRSPDNPDYLDTTRLRYVLTCDDPALCKAPFLAAKNVLYPNAQEIAAVEYYIEHFVWGGLQRTDEETPNPYGIYGTPDWLTNRNTQKREANTDDPNRFKMHIWRSYDYPHIMMMYYHMFQIADMYPNLVHYADRTEYLKRMKETAKAYFTYPYEILPWYETYKWGCYNEMLIPEIIDLLKKEGFNEDAEFLTGEWEKKVKYFIYDDKYPFRSEYAVDATAFESSYALAKYGVLNKMQPDKKLWYDKNEEHWYSHPKVSQQDAADFMDRQLAANLALRGVLEPAYYWLGSDFRGRSEFYTLSYMAQMGGWAVLDQALQFMDKPADYLRIGYQSYLSSFALINSGTAASDYGFWYGGKENDGATGWAFEPEQSTTSWIQKPQGRGPWYYDGEIDLGFGAATRTAATILTDDDVFGTVAYGGNLEKSSNGYKVIPRDGIRQRFFVRIAETKLDVVLMRDGFAKETPIVWNPETQSLSFTLENRTNDDHTTSIEIKGLNGKYQVKQGANTLIKETKGSDIHLELKMSNGDTPAIILERMEADR